MESFFLKSVPAVVAIRTPSPAPPGTETPGTRGEPKPPAAPGKRRQATLVIAPTLEANTGFMSNMAVAVTSMVRSPVSSGRSSSVMGEPS